MPTMAPTQRQQQAHVLLGERLVDDVRTRKGWASPTSELATISDHDHGQPGAVRREQPADPAQGDGGVRELPLVGRVGTRAAASAAAADEVIHATPLSG